MFDLIISRIRSNFLHYFLILIGYITALMIISFGVNLISLSKSNSVNLSSGEVNHQREISIDVNDSLNIDYNKLVNILKKYSETTSIRIEGLTEDFEIDGSIGSYELKPLIFTDIPEWIPKISEGRYFNSNEIKSDIKNAIVGGGVVASNLVNDNKIKIGGEEFNVIGIAGRANDGSNYAGSIFIPLESLPNKKKQEIKSLQVCILKNSGDPEEEMKLLLHDLSQLPGIRASETNIKGQSSEFYMKFSMIIFIELIIILVSVGNMSVLIFYLMLKNKKEILISITLGATKKIIWKQVFNELILISVSSIIITVIMQNILMPLVKANFTMFLNIEELGVCNFNILITMVVSIVMSLLISIISVKKFFKLNIVTELKGE